MDPISLFLGYLLVIVLMSYGFGMLIGGATKGSAILNWEWKQVKKFFKWIISLIIKMFQAIHRNIKT